MKTFKDILTTLTTDTETIKWVGDKKIEEVISKCHDGNWMLWLAGGVGVSVQEINVAKAKSIINMLQEFTDESGLKAVEVATAFGEGRASEERMREAINVARANYESTHTAQQMRNTPFYDFQSADICRKYLGEPIIRKVNKLLNNN